jgi:hypothetical protein
LTVDVIFAKLAGTFSVRTLFDGVQVTGFAGVETGQTLLTLSVADGLAYWARLKKLKASVLKMTLLRSVTRKVFSMAESFCHKAGPAAMFRPEFPQAPTAGKEKAAGLIHCWVLRVGR